MSDLLCTVIGLYTIAIFVWIILSWIRVPTDHPVGRLGALLGSIIEPVLRPIRSLVPPVRMGAVGLDLSPLILFVVLRILSRLVC